MQLFDSLLLSIHALNDGDAKLKWAHIGNILSIAKAYVPDKGWIGIYLLIEGDLILGPFQGTPACEKIKVGKGVVGECFASNKTILVEDVSKYPNYICCDEATKSELCVPLLKEGKPIGVLDIDYPEGKTPAEDQSFYEEVAKVMSDILSA